MKKSWYQILNIFQSPSPSVSDSILRGVLCGYLSDYQHLSAPTRCQKQVLMGAVRITGAKMKKDTGNLSDYQCLSYCFGVKSHR